MHLISIDASPRQVSKLRNGHPVRVKHGKGVFVVVHPNNYNLVSRAFRKGKGSQLQLSSEEVEANKGVSPEMHQEMVNNSEEGVFDEDAIEGQGLYAGAVRGGSLKSFGRTLSKTYKSVSKHPIVKDIAKVVRPIIEDMAHQEINKAHGKLSSEYGDDKLTSSLIDAGAKMAHKKASGKGFNDLRRQSLGNYSAGVIGDSISKTMKAVRSSSMPIKSYYNADGQPPSRGNGLSGFHQRKHSMVHDMNLMRGRGSMIQQDFMLPPAMVSQPYGANFHMQYFLPPQYKRYNDGGIMEGTGMYA